MPKPGLQADLALTRGIAGKRTFLGVEDTQDARARFYEFPRVSLLNLALQGTAFAAFAVVCGAFRL